MKNTHIHIHVGTKDVGEPGMGAGLLKKGSVIETLKFTRTWNPTTQKWVNDPGSKGQQIIVEKVHGNDIYGTKGEVWVLGKPNWRILKL